LELAAKWDEARIMYDGSDLASHVYRLAVCDLILGAPVDALSAWPDDRIKKFIAGMLEFNAETDRAGILRSESFVSACRWSGFDNWLIDFELGRLGFQRRHHTEAERHLARAASASPERFRYPILSLRFSNLTWLGEMMGVSMLPEALEAGHEALRAAAPEEEKLHIRTWIAREGRQPELLAPVLASSNHLARGDASSIVGNIPDALRAWCAGIGGHYNARTFQALMSTFASYGFEHTAASLCEIVALESEDSFFELWELAKEIARVLERQPPARLVGGPLADVLHRVEARMEQLVESEFQHAIRAFHHFLERREPGPAVRVRLRAERLAEGSEELLLLAMARRKAARGWDPRAAELLEQARPESKDRFERLIIARELVELGEPARARAILEEEGVLGDTSDLTPIEFVVAVRCAKQCASEAERAQLEKAASDALERDVAAGRFVHDAGGFVVRLNTVLEERHVTVPAAASDAAREAEISEWRELTALLARLKDQRHGDQELRLLNERVAAVSGPGSPFSRLALWGLHFDRFDAHMRMVDQLRPTVSDDEVPLARDLTPVRPRAQRLAELWRANLLAKQDVRAIQEFLAEERELTRRWDLRRIVEAEEPSSHALGYARQGAMLLERIGADHENGAIWPGYLDVERAIVADATRLAASLQERAASVRKGVRS
jgi:hypothetical protein